VVSYIALGAGARVVEVSVQHWRRAVLGSGRAQKKDVVAWATDFAQRDGLGTDEAEAIALARYGVLWLNQSLKRSIRRSSKEVSTRNGTFTRPGSRSVDRRNRKRQK
jgi:Holliday junction resolvasome RuvABC endonuclease subunit